jgi:hypothetical protein
LKPVHTEPTTNHTKAALTPSTFRSGRCYREVASYALPDANNNSDAKTINLKSGKFCSQEQKNDV